MSDSQKTYRRFKSLLTRRLNKRDYRGLIVLWHEFSDHYDLHGSWPDDWSNWSRAAQDAEWAIKSNR
jgi:hypothetical protein